MYNWIDKDKLINQADHILALDEFVPNAFLTIIMESNNDNFQKTVKWIEDHQKEYNTNSRERALIGSDLIKLDALERKEVLSFVESNPNFQDILISSKL